jgi:hypothetical protein
VAGSVEDGAAIGNAGDITKLQLWSFDAGRQMPRIDAAPIDGRLATHRVHTNPIQEGGQERVTAKGLVEPGDACRGARQCVRESEVDIQRSGRRGEELVKNHAVLRTGAAGREQDRDASRGHAYVVLAPSVLIFRRCTGKRSSSIG